MKHVREYFPVDVWRPFDSMNVVVGEIRSSVRRGRLETSSGEHKTNTRETPPLDQRCGNLRVAPNDVLHKVRMGATLVESDDKLRCCELFLVVLDEQGARRHHALVDKPCHGVAGANCIEILEIAAGEVHADLACMDR